VSLYLLSTEKLQLVTPSAGDVDVVVSYVDRDITTLTAPTDTPSTQNTTIITATTTDVLGAPGSAPVKRNNRTLTVRNTHATVAQNGLLLQKDIAGVKYEVCQFDLAAKEYAIIDEKGVLFVYDTKGGVRMGATAASDTAAGLVEIADQPEMEAGTDITRAVSPGRAHFHPSAAKCWLSCGVAADIQQSYNITSLTDTGTGIVTVTINVDFAAATYCSVSQVEKAATTLASTDARQCNLRSATRAVGSFALDCKDDTATTNLIKDPTTWHVACYGDLP
jgi:hypothetical protein